MKFPSNIEARLARHLENGPAGCTLFCGGKNGHGYGVLRVNGVTLYAHRISWEIAFGPIPDGLWVLHRCDVRNCVNPAHLFLGNNADNLRDAAIKGRIPRGDRHTATKIPEAKLSEIRLRYRRGMGPELAKEFGVTKTTITNIARHSQRIPYDSGQ